MTKEEKDKILKALAEDRNDYARDCNRRIAEENGKITGADYMLQRFLDILNTEVEPQVKSEEKEMTYGDIYNEFRKKFPNCGRKLRDKWMGIKY